MITALCVLLAATMAVTPAPRDQLAMEMILHEVAQHGAMAKSVTTTDPGQCRRFQVNAFAAVADGYALEGYPGVSLFLPEEHEDYTASGRVLGAAWQMPEASEGNAYVEVARFDFQRGTTLKHNRDSARAFLRQVRAGDVLQMMARYSSGGRGTHTLLFTRPYDPRSGMLYWVDSNFANTLVDGVRYGYVRAYQAWPFEDVVQWLTADGNNGATLYRLSDQIVAGN